MRQINHYLISLLVILVIVASCSDSGNKDDDEDTSSSGPTEILETVCSNDVPEGALVTCKIQDEICESGEKVTYIANADELPSGAETTICGIIAPSGWEILSELTVACCTTGSSPNAIRIRKL